MQSRKSRCSPPYLKERYLWAAEAWVPVQKAGNSSLGEPVSSILRALSIRRVNLHRFIITYDSLPFTPAPFHRSFNF